MAGNTTVTATFTLIPPPNRTLTVTFPTNGTITGNGISCGTLGTDCTEIYPNATVVNLDAIPDAGYLVQAWGGDCTGSGTTCALTMTANQSASIAFMLQ